MNSVAIFSWKGPLPSDAGVGADPATRYSGDFGEQWLYQATKPVALAVFEAVRSREHRTTTDRPFFAEHFWTFDFRLDRHLYAINVFWIPQGNRHDVFAMEPSVARGCLVSLFGRRPPESALRPVCDVLDEALRAHPLVAELRWVQEVDWSA